MRLAHSKSDILMLLGSLLLAAGGLAGIQKGEFMGWVATGFFLLCAAIFAAAPWLRARQEARLKQTLRIDDWGVSRRLPGGDVEALQWEHVMSISIITTGDGPFAEDVFFALIGPDEKGVLIGQDLATEHKLLEKLQQRFPDLDNEAVIRAMGSTSEARFVIWRPKPGQRVESMGEDDL